MQAIRFSPLFIYISSKAFTRKEYYAKNILGRGSNPADE